MTGLRVLFAAMFREEWRLHARLFGGRRFAAFPVLVNALAAAAVWGLRETGTPVADTVAGVHVLVLFLGLHTGSVGLVGRDALRGVLGDASLLVRVARWLPVSETRAVAVFLVKDVVYYAGLFLAPLVLAFAPVAAAGALPVSRLPLLFVALTATFALGVGCTLVGLAAAAHGYRVRAAVVLVLAAVGGLWYAGYDPLAATPYAIYAAPATPGALAGLALSVAVPAAGVAAFDPGAERPARTVPDQFRPWRARLDDGDGLLTRSLLDVARSGGGLWKVAFSGGVLFAVAAFLVGTVEGITGIVPSTGVAFGALLGLTAFTTYNWLTQFDDVESYAALPAGTPAILRAKFRAFLLLGTPTALGYLGLAAVVFGARAAELAVGALLAVGVGWYLFGVTVYLAGLRPGEFLFDTGLYAAFTLAVSVVLVPVLVVGFVLAPVDAAALAGLAAVAVAAGGAGYGLYRRAIPRWTRRYRTGEF